MTLLSIFICLAQISALMLAAGILAGRLRPRAPAAAATIALAGLLTSLTLVLLTIADVPRPFESWLVVSPNTIAARIESPSSAEIDSAVQARLQSEPTASPGTSVFLTDMLHMVCAEWLTSAPRRTPTRSWMGTVLWVLAAVALLPVMAGLIGTIQIHRRSRLLDRESAKRLGLLAKIGRQGELRFRTSDLVPTPCVTLYGGRSIYLPADWSQWSDSELAAAVAHEAAHLRRGDPLKRLIGQMAASLLCFHPMAIWLARGMLLSQEMAADRDAIAAQGYQYTQSLSAMALRMDASIDARAGLFSLNQWLLRPGIVSVSSSHLIRRIEMLTNEPIGRASRRMGMISHVAVVALFAACACWTVRADQPTDDTKVRGASQPAARIANLPTDNTDDPVPFARQPSRPWDELSPNDTGFVTLDTASLFDHPVLGMLLPSVLDPYLDIGWQVVTHEEAVNRRGSLGLTTTNVKRVVGTLNYNLFKKPATDGADSMTTMMIGSKGAKFWFDQPVDHNSLRASLDSQRIAKIMEAGGTSEADLGGKTYIEFVDFMLSKIFTDGANTAELLVPPPEEEFDEFKFSCLKKGWQVVDGGAVTACYTLPKTLGFIENIEDAAVESVLKHAACTAVGVEFDPASGPANVRIALVPRNDISPEVLQGIIQNLIDIGESKFEEVVNSDDADQDTIEAVEKAQAILDTLQMRTAASNGSDGEDCVFITVGMSLDALALLLNL